MEKDLQKVVACLKSCATGSFRACHACSYRSNCNQLIVDTVALLEKGCDLSKEVHPMSNNPEENRRIVREGLERRKAARLEAESEARLDEYERDMIRFCNDHNADAKVTRKATADDWRCKTMSMERIESRKNARIKKWERRGALSRAVKLYAGTCLFLLWATTWSYLPIWAAVTASIGLGALPAALAIRLYKVPIKRKEGAIWSA